MFVMRESDNLASHPSTLDPHETHNTVLFLTSLLCQRNRWDDMKLLRIKLPSQDS